MRKIASNYLLAPDGRIVRRGFLIYDGGKVCGWGELSCGVAEEHGVEFYGGMIVAGELSLKEANMGEHIVSYIHRIGYHFVENNHGITLISNLDWSDMRITNGTTVSVIR